MSDLDNSTPEGAAVQIINGSHPTIQNAKADFSGLANSTSSQDSDTTDSDQPLTHYHSFFYDLFTWKFPRATGFFFFAAISLIFAFRFVNVLRYVFKATYILFFLVTFLEIASKPFGTRGFISSIRPKPYYTIPRDSLDRLFGELHDLLNFFALEFQRVLFAENIFATVVASFVSFIGYFLIKYIPLWALSLLTTITAFTAPLIYLQNQEVIDEQIQWANEYANAQLANGRQIAEKYIDDASVRARATASELTQKVQGYAGKKSPATEKSQASSLPENNSPSHEFPDVPKSGFPAVDGESDVKAAAPEPIVA
ncbi:unnamed protein product [Tuber melanosporum]|jgi:hypothetical protein|uniref:Reticulon-like protein n=1 Tax=Tuber melanosporum (strain Mel28) TaxID=656061 RepID=D5GF26_TUBMM|nr:uncharacterized protein GSTUM_00006712001 [Tuber melanosporum]KAG0137966.1 Reticulon-domain-containing protein [Tuber indicum]CAZ83119.1 unnamed protein product [Tuber melanosporum]